MLSALGCLAFAAEDGDGAGEPGEKPRTRKPKPKGEVQISFTPPPMDGVITMGVFDSNKKLVRVLHTGATEKDFKIGLNGFITRWDGRDDAGADAPAGKYHMRGWCVGNLKAEGVAFHCNDWATDEGPRYARVLALKPEGRDEMRVTLRDVDGKDAEVAWKLAKPDTPEPGPETAYAVAEGRLTVRDTAVKLGEGGRAVAGAAGYGGNVWAIVETPDGREVRGYSTAGEFLRRLAYAKGEPLPQQIAGSQWSETVFLLEENEREQRLRALALTEKDGAPAWKTVYQKRIVFSATFDAVAGELGRAEPVKAAASLRVLSKANPLLQNKRTPVELVVRTDDTGALLATTDGLPLLHVSEAKGLKWAALAQEGKSVRLFQGDGVIVEELALGKPENLMEFDAGNYDLLR